MYRLINLFILLLATHAFGQPYQNAFQQIRKGEYAAATTALNAMLQRNANDDSAHYYLGILPLYSNDEKQYDGGVAHLEQCITAKPNSAKYQLAYGQVLGSKAGRAGVLKAMGYAGKIRDAFKKATELDPKNYEAREGLNQYYLQAPGIVGGGADKARANAKDYEAHYLDGCRVLWAQIYVKEEAIEKAAGQLISVQQPNDARIRSSYIGAMVNLLNMCLEGNKDLAQADRLLAQAGRVWTNEPVQWHYAGRLRLAQGRTDEAIQLLEKAVAANFVGSNYRLGLIYLQRGDKAKAKSCLQAFVTKIPQKQGKAYEDAQSKLKTL